MKDQKDRISHLEMNIKQLKKQNKALKIQYEKEVQELRQAETIRKMQYNIADAVVNAGNIKELFETVRYELSRLIDTKNFYIAFYDDNTKMCHSPFEVDEMHNIPEWPAEKSLTGLVLKQKKPLLLNKEQTLKLADSNKADLIGKTAESWLGVPLVTRKKAIGAIVVQNYDNPKAYDENCKDVLQIIANQLSIYIEIKRTQDALIDSEKRYRSILENAFDGIYILYGKSFEFVNDRFCEITEYSKKELLSKSFSLNDLLTKEGQELIEKRYNDRLKGIEVPSIIEFKIFAKSGLIKDIQISNTALSIEGKPRVLGIMRDVTELKRAYALEQEVAVARKSVEFKQNFLANVSHEIRTPLTGVLGMAEILGKTKLDSDQIYYLTTLMQSAENLREIIDLILDYSKIEAGKIKLRKNKFSLQKLIPDAINIFLPEAEEKGIKLEYNIDSKIPKLLIGDRQRINQIILNLLTNAIKFTEKGNISLKATLLNDSVNGNTKDANEEMSVKINVMDTGKGISEKDKEYIFKPFSQIERSSVRFTEGTGLGLAICKELATLLKGDIGFESKLGKGSDFWFTFKVNPATESVDKVKKKKFKNIRFSKSLNILFVEDKKVTQTVVRIILKSMGHRVDTADNGEHALEVFKPGKYDLILMDIQMPVMDGITATKVLREKYPELCPIVGLSANAFEGDRKKYMNLGLDDYLTKPVNSQDFNELLERLF